MKHYFLTLILLCCSGIALSQDLLKERIRKLSNNKTSIYVEKGIFHNGGVKLDATLNSIRQSYNENQGYERIVIDFNTKSVPKIYGHISSVDKKISIDLFETKLNPELKTINSTKYVEKINFFPIESNHVSIDMQLRNKVIADVFLLENPGRLVIDLKN